MEPGTTALPDGATLTALPDGSTLITVTGKNWRGSPRLVGIYTVTDGTPRWTPAVDGHVLAVLGTVTGLVAATLGSLAVLRRPPWPDLARRCGRDGD